ncbi:PREDICTED: putative F-box protein At3g16210 [Camelina sativa]|uniref:F-box protein At3g16210 n=1 Tax=Camelina sativa TaxID=90675 RepID=A0ABM0XRJ5_CAMSA|nr:PREDICTED: putative F-box protein At3g16210 [Camelina sativa]
MRWELPFDLMVEILARVPVKDLARFRCVCKSWLSLFQDERFIKQHMSHAPTRIMSFRGWQTQPCHFSFETSTTTGKQPPEMIVQEVVKLNIGDEVLLRSSGLIGHCHGLFCLDLEDNTFGIWNPALRDFRRIQTRHLNNWAEMGFGYDHSTQDYKLVLVPNMKEGSCSQAQVLSLKSGVSRLIDFPSLENFSMCHMRLPGTLMGQNIYWQVYDRDRKVALTETILCFDLVSESFSYCPGPSTCGQGFPHAVVGLTGGLCTVGVDLSCGDLIVWSAQHEKEENTSIIKSWNKILSLSRGIVVSSVAHQITKCWLVSAVNYAGLLLFLVNIGREAKLLAYNFEDKSLRIVQTSLSLDRYGPLQTYVETLVPIPGASL